MLSDELLPPEPPEPPALPDEPEPTCVALDIAPSESRAMFT